MSELKTLKFKEEGYGLLIESDAGYIDPNDNRNKEVIKEVFDNIGKVDPSNYGKTKFPLELTAVLQKADIVNQNGRLYPKHILEKQIEAYKELIINRVSGSQNDHPESATISISGISNRVTEIHWEGNTVVGKILIYLSLGFVNMGIVSSPGDEIGLLLSYNHRVGVSSRSLGSVKKINGIDQVQSDLELICFDVVATPSTRNAWILTDESEKSKYVESKVNDSKPLLETKVDNFLNLLN